MNDDNSSDDAQTRGDFHRAVAGLYFHAYSDVAAVPDGAWATAEVVKILNELPRALEMARPVPFQQALDTVLHRLANNPTKFEHWAGRRCLVKLIGGGRKMEAAALAEYYHIPIADLGVPDPHDRIANEQKVEQALLSAGQDDCATSLPPNGPGMALDMATASMTINAMTLVNGRSPQVVARAMDPQAWPGCNPYFARCFIIEQTDYQYPWTPRPPAAGPPQPLGSQWSQVELVYEDFVLVPGLDEIANGLGFRATWPDPDRYELVYWLDRSWYTNFWLSKQTGGLSDDSGFAYVTAQGSDTVIQGRKTLGFYDRHLPDGSVVSGSTLMLATAALMLVAMDSIFLKGACCEPPHDATPTVISGYGESEPPPDQGAS